jgi:hypothetical protein
MRGEAYQNIARLESMRGGQSSRGVFHTQITELMTASVISS